MNNILLDLKEHHGSFINQSDSIVHSYICNSAYRKRKCCPLAFLVQQTGEYCNNDDFDKFQHILQLTKEEVEMFIIASDFHVKNIEDNDIKNLRRNILYTLKLKEHEIPDMTKINFIKFYRKINNEQ